MYNHHHGSEPSEAEPASSNHDRSIFNNNPNTNQVNGSGNQIINYVINRNVIPPKERHEQLTVHIQLAASLPPRPLAIHGREAFVNGLVRLVTQSTTVRLAVLGAGGMGKTTVVLEVLYDVHVVEVFGDGRLFLSCEALVDANAIIVKLAELYNIAPTTPNLQSVVVAYLASMPRTVLVLDNLETVWLAGGAPVAAVDELLGTLAQIPSLWLMIACRSTILPQAVRWSNANAAALEPFSLDAALKTFADKAGYNLSGPDRELAEELLIAVDRMPLAVSLLGQLAQRGNSLLELLDRWNREHSALLRTHNIGRDNNVEVSIGLSIAVLLTADTSQESLHLLSLCSMLPDGLRPEVLEKLRSQFKYIERARDSLSAYALVNIGIDRTISVLNPIRHFVSDHYPARSEHHNALCSVYFDIAKRLPIEMDEHYKQLAATVAPEMGNLSSLLLMLCRKTPQLDASRTMPAKAGTHWFSSSLRRIQGASFRGSSTQCRCEEKEHDKLHRFFNAVLRFAGFAYWRQSSATLVYALLPHLETHPRWKADCVRLLGNHQLITSDYRAAIASFTAAARLYLRVRNRSLEAQCKCDAGSTHRLLGENDNAEALLIEAGTMYRKLGDRLGEAKCRLNLGNVMHANRQYSTAIGHLIAAQQTFDSLGHQFSSAQCSECLGLTYSAQNNFQSAAAELRTARSAFITLGHQHHQAQSTCQLGDVERIRGNFTLAEQFLNEAEKLYKVIGERLGLAVCAHGFGNLRRDQKRWEDAAQHFQSASKVYEALEMDEQARECKVELQSIQAKL